MASVSILITNYKTIDFVKLSLYSLTKLTKNEYKVLINDNGSSEEELRQLREIEKNNSNIIVNFRHTDAPPSYAHGEALDILIGLVDTEYFTVLDSDCVFLMKNWDSYLISKLDHEVKVIGTTYTVNKASKKHNDFPAQFAVMFETKAYKKLKISCMPQNQSDKDTCWEWRGKYLSSNYSGKVLKQINTRHDKATPFGKIICVVFYTDEDEVIASHFGRGSSGGEYKYSTKFIAKLPILGKYIRKYLAYQEKKDWIIKCQMIIDKSN